MTWPRTDRQRSVVQLADDLAGPIAARAAEIDSTGRFPYENVDELFRAGYLALTIPERFGGFGANPLEFALASERLAQACASTGLISVMHLALMGRYGEIGLWPDDVYGAVSHEVLTRGALINSVNSEPDLGSPSRGALPSTTATRVSGGWLINGRKRWATMAPALSYAFSLVTVIDGDTEPRRANVLIPLPREGVSVDHTWANLGMRGTASHDLVYENVLVDEHALLPADGSAVPGDGKGWYAFPSAAAYLGIAVAARDAAIAFASERIPNGMPHPISHLQTIQHKFAEMEILILQARTLLYTTAETWIEQPFSRSDMEWQLAALKYTVVQTVLRVTEIAQRVVGSVALTDASPVQRHFRDARTIIGHPPMEDAILTLVGQRSLGISANPVQSGSLVGAERTR